jgi:hypothetical protein
METRSQNQFIGRAEVDPKVAGESKAAALLNPARSTALQRESPLRSLSASPSPAEKNPSSFASITVSGFGSPKRLLGAERQASNPFGVCQKKSPVE